MRTGSDLRAAMSDITYPTWEAKDEVPTPWALQVADQTWALTTNGHVFVAVDRACIPGECPAPPAKIVTHATEWLAVVQTSPTVIPAHALNAFAGVGRETAPCDTCRGARRVDCEECGGDGECECECDCGHLHTSTCEDCDGKGDLSCPDCVGDEGDRLYAHLLSGMLNRTVLRTALTVLQLDDATELLVSYEAIAHGCYVLRPAIAVPPWMVIVSGLAKGVQATAVFEKPETWQAVAV